MENQESQDFDWIVAKLPKKDKQGRDTSEDVIGVGGKHRKDGTYSAMPYDIELCEDNPITKADTLEEKVKRLEAEENDNEDYYYEPEEERTTLDAVVDCAEAVANLTEKAVDLVVWAVEMKEWWRSRKERKQRKNSQKELDEYVEESKCEYEYDLERDLYERTIDNSVLCYEEDESLVDEYDYSTNKVELTIDEARLIFIDMLVNYLKFKKDYNLLASANIKGISVDIKSFDDVVAFFDRCVEIYPQLMDLSTTSIVKGILEANLDEDEIIQTKKALKILEI